VSVAMSPDQIDAVRSFNRFYTRQIGALQERLLQSPFSLSEARLLYELGQRKETVAAELSSSLGLDPGYISRVIRSFREKGLVDVQPCQSDARCGLIRLTKSGYDAFASLDASSRDQIKAVLVRLSDCEQARLVDAMRTVEEVLTEQRRPTANLAYVLRPPRPGDLGWVVQRHGELYAKEYGWDERFEALVARIVADFVEQNDPERDRAWIAEVGGRPVGTVFLVKGKAKTARLRLLLVDPEARGFGIGTRLVEECVRFAKKAGYKRITLWTNSVLEAARRIYTKAGFKVVKTEPHASFGHPLVGETWVLNL
jgi:DNA-binding MarR family transcriptional regulator/GNAT superfamily N-acetyltransferase